MTNMQQDLQAAGVTGGPSHLLDSPSQWFLPFAAATTTAPQERKAPAPAINHADASSSTAPKAQGDEISRSNSSSGGGSRIGVGLLMENIKAAHMCLESLEVMDSIEPIKIMGVKCEARHAAWIVYMLLVLLFVMFQYAFAGEVKFTG
jgi:hypothetical protein